MSLSQALSTAVAGLRVTQTGLSLVAANVANAETPGYVKKTISPVTTASAAGISVRTADVQRHLDQYVQRALRSETSGASYASTRADFYNQVQTIYGQPGSSTTLEAVFNNFTKALQALTTSPDSQAARSNVLGTAQVLAQQLNTTTQSIQSLRTDAELGLSDAVTSANNAMAQIASINSQLAAYSSSDPTTATLLDQRDSYINQLADLMDISVVQDNNNQVRVFTTSGIQLVGNQASTLKFDGQGQLGADNLWDADPTKRSVGTVSLVGRDGAALDLIANGSIRSGKIAALLQLRDQDLVQAQNQLDAIAAGLASALSNTTTPGTAATSGAQTGFDLDTAALQAGNTINVTYTDRASGQTRNLTFMRVDDPRALPLSDSATANGNDTVIGLDFSGSMSSVITQINQALITRGMTASNPSGSTIRLLNDSSGRATVNAASTTTTATSFTSGSLSLPFFTDAGVPYTGAITLGNNQTSGLAGRIQVNSDLYGDPSRLVKYTATTPAADSSRATFILNQLTSKSMAFSAGTGIGTNQSPFSGTIGSFVRQVISTQGQAADTASSLNEGQQVVLTSLQKRFNDTASVNIDEEMSTLLQLQNTYGANARVMTTIKDMLDSLMNSMR